MTRSRPWLAVAGMAALCAGPANPIDTPAPTASAPPVTAPAITIFEVALAEAGQASAGWTVPRAVSEQGYSAAVAADLSPGGARSLRLQAPAAGQPAGTFGNLMRSFDATPYRGQRIRFRAAVKVEAAGAVSHPEASGTSTEGAGKPVLAQLWVRVDRPGGVTGFFDNMGDRPLTATSWGSGEIVGEVAADAVRISLGLILQGDGRAWLGDATFAVLGKKVEADEPARAIDARGVENLVALARLAGMVRYFHPSDQAAGADWNAFLRAGVERVERADGPRDLAHILTALFLPLAPTLRVFPADRPEPMAPELRAAPGGPAPPRILAWCHLGLGNAANETIYESRRITGDEGPRRDGLGSREIELDSEGGAVSVTLPAPNTPLRVDLGGGVSALVPLALYTGTGAGGTLPLVPPDVQPPAPSRPDGFVPSGNDRATRLADVILAWNVFEHFYPYFDVVAVDWPGELRRALRSAATDRDEGAFLLTLRRLVAALHDGHGNAISTHGAVSFHLPLLWEWAQGELVVTEVDGEHGGGVRRGDVVTAIDGRPVKDVLAAEEELTSAATPQWRRFRALYSLLLGPPASVRLDLRRAIPGTEGAAGAPGYAGTAGTTLTVTLQRSLPSFGPGALEERRPEKVAEVAPGIWYVDVGRASDDDWRAALPKLSAARGIVFDFRGYPKLSPLFLRHLSSQPLRSAQWRVPILVRPDREGMKFLTSSWNLTPLEPHLTAKLVFVTDGRAISYAESCLGIIEHYRLGEIVGGPTAGTNGNINPFNLPGGFRILWTGMQVLKQDGSRHHGVGILPTVPASRTLAGIRLAHDELLDQAVSLASR